MMSSSTKAQSKQLLGVHAALRSKKPLTPQTLLEFEAMKSKAREAKEFDKVLRGMLTTKPFIQRGDQRRGYERGGKPRRGKSKLAGRSS
jgi:hypothetical protein